MLFFPIETVIRRATNLPARGYHDSKCEHRDKDGIPNYDNKNNLYSVSRQVKFRMDKVYLDFIFIFCGVKKIIFNKSSAQEKYI